MSAPVNLRKSMPLVTAFIDDFREAFGADVINPQIRRGMAGEIGFWASENGVEVGTKFPEPRYVITAAQMIFEKREKDK